MDNPQIPQTTHAYACLSCAHKKIKCDRLSPCRNCSKSSGECVYRPPRPPKRRRRRDIEKELLAKLNRYDEIFNKLGVGIEGTITAANDTPVAGYSVDGDRSPQSSASAQLNETVKVTEKFRDGLWSAGAAGNGRLVTDRGCSRYLEKYVVTILQILAVDSVLTLVRSSLWTSLSDEVRAIPCWPSDFC